MTKVLPGFPAGLQITPGRTFPVLKNLLEEKGCTLVGDSPFIAAIVLKALKTNDINDELQLEIFEFICIYCSVLGPMISFTNEETDFLLSHLSDYIRQVEKTAVVLQESHVPKKGRNKRMRADLNADTSDKPQVNADVHAAAIQALMALFVTDPRAVSEITFKSVAGAVAREVLQVNASRDAMSEDCVYSQARNRKLLYKLLELVAKYPMFPQHRPLHIALHFFAEAARWDIRDIYFKIPSFCRSALLTLELITDPVIAPVVWQPESSTTITDPGSEAAQIDDSGDDDEQQANAVLSEKTGDEAGASFKENAVEANPNEGASRPMQIVGIEAVGVAISELSVQPKQSKGGKEEMVSNSCGDQIETAGTGSTVMSEATVMDMITISDDSGDEISVPQRVPVISSQPLPVAQVASLPAPQQESESAVTRVQTRSQRRNSESVPVKEPEASFSQPAGSDTQPTRNLFDVHAFRTPQPVAEQILEDQIVEEIEDLVTGESVHDILGTGDFDYD